MKFLDSKCDGDAVRVRRGLMASLFPDRDGVDAEGFAGPERDILWQVVG